MITNYAELDWFGQLSPHQQLLVKLSLDLLAREKALNSELSDYAFVIFPMAKAYEGFLKSYIFSLGLIDEKTFKGNRFRIGRALNPDVSSNRQDEHWVFDDIAQMCGDSLSQQLWNTWLECRNRIFHYYPEKEDKVSLEKAEQHLELMGNAIKSALECKRLDQELRIKNGYKSSNW